MPHSTLELDNHTRKPPEERLRARRQLRELYALPIYRLPAELIIKVLDHLDLEDYPAFIVAAMPLLRQCGFMQDVDTPRLRSLLLQARRGFYASFSAVADPSNRDYMPPVFRHHILHRLSPRDGAFRSLTTIPLRLRGGFERLPAELRNQIFDFLGPDDKMRLVLACYRFSDDDIERLTHEKV